LSIICFENHCFDGLFKQTPLLNQFILLRTLLFVSLKRITKLNNPTT